MVWQKPGKEKNRQKLFPIFQIPVEKNQTKKQGTEKKLDKSRAKKKHNRNCSLFFTICCFFSVERKPNKKTEQLQQKNRELKLAKTGQRKNIQKLYPIFQQNKIPVEKNRTKKQGTITTTKTGQRKKRQKFFPIF